MSEIADSTGPNSTLAAPRSSGGAPELDATPSKPRVKPTAHGYYLGTGRRKSAVARVRLKLGSGQILVNGRKFDDYFTEHRDRNAVLAPLKAANAEGKFDIWTSLHGGGYMGQAGAVRLGIARALKNFDPEFEPALRNEGLLTRDPREVERKKYGKAGARRRFQFSKR